MKLGIILVVLLMSSVNLRADELNIITNYGQALEQARASSRPLLVVLSRDVKLPTSDRQSGHSVLSKYVVCSIDTDSSYGTRVAKAFRATEFPYSAIIDRTGKKILYSKTGSFSEESWTAILTKYEGGMVNREVSFRETQPQPAVQPQFQPYAREFTGGNQRYTGARGFAGRGRAYCST